MKAEKTLNELTQLPNVGMVLAQNLIEIGVKSKQDFLVLGAEKAFIRILAIHKGACLNQLFALEGAEHNIRWHNITKERKEELKSFFRGIER